MGGLEQSRRGGELRRVLGGELDHLDEELRVRQSSRVSGS
jgi:hypothetical protein